MTVAKSPDAETQGETPSWAWPVHAFVVWLTAMLDYVTRFKRARRFKSDWRDSWEDLRHAEWHRDQLIAQGVAQLLAGQPLQLDDTKIQLTAPATYGGPCPRTPFDMNRRFIALARWAADPEAIIRERFKRISRIPLAAHGSTDALRAAHHEAVGAAESKTAAARVALMVSSDPGLDPGERPSNHEGGLTSARGPPPRPIQQTNSPYLSATARLRLHPVARPARTSGGPISHRSAASRRTGTSCGRGPVS